MLHRTIAAAAKAASAEQRANDFNEYAKVMSYFERIKHMEQIKLKMTSQLQVYIYKSAEMNPSTRRHLIQIFLDKRSDKTGQNFRCISVNITDPLFITITDDNEIIKELNIKDVFTFLIRQESA